jgi:uncharacterized protein
MVLEGVVTNVAAFGAFVDIGVHQDGLVHVSAMSRSFISAPREKAKPGDVVRVKVLGVDLVRKRVSLSMRLDDEPGGARGARGPAAGDGAGGAGPRGARGDRSGQGGGRGGGSGGRTGTAGGGAMAEALRRAGLAEGDTGDQRRDAR